MSLKYEPASEPGASAREKSHAEPGAVRRAESMVREPQGAPQRARGYREGGGALQEQGMSRTQIPRGRNPNPETRNLKPDPFNRDPK